MVLRRYYGLLYGVLVVLIVALGAWWVIFLTQEGRNYERYQLQRMATDRIHAEYLIRTVPEVQSDPTGQLGETYPHLIFRATEDGITAEIDSLAVARVQREARRRQRMFTGEGIFFLLLLAAGTTILTLAYRSERAFKRARELFLTGATHELKTPLASLRLYTETLDRPELGAEESGRIRTRMLEDIGRLELLAEQILALGYEEEDSRSRYESLDVAEEVQAVLAEMDGFIRGHGARVETDLLPDQFVRGQRFVFALVLRNLLSNAVLHSPPPARVAITSAREGQWLRLSVQDHGPGIPRAERKRIFQEFVRAVDRGGSHAPLKEGHRHSAGAGLGLYLVKRKMEMMGGKVELDSEVGKGSTFTLALPVHGKEER